MVFGVFKDFVKSFSVINYYFWIIWLNLIVVLLEIKKFTLYKNTNFKKKKKKIELSGPRIELRKYIFWPQSYTQFNETEKL